MEIRTVEIQEDGSYLVNKNVDENDDRQLCVPDDMDNRHRVHIQEWIDDGNTPMPFVGPTDMELWKEKMVRSDGPLPRWGEDLVDGTISSQTQKLADDKKVLRATKP
jgi:hypothetical protein